MRFLGRAAACLGLVTQISSQSTRFEDSLLRAVDLAVGESEDVVFSDGKRARVKLLDLQETRDQVCGAVRRAQVKVEINGQPATDGSRATGAQVRRRYEQPGYYSEILKVTDADGRVDYDFAIVQVVDRANPKQIPPTIHPNYAPALGVKPGDPVTFKVRTFGTQDGDEKWDFGDGTPIVKTKSDGNIQPLAPEGYAETVHRFEKPGLYLVRVERSNSQGLKAMAHLKVRIGDEP